MTVIVKETYSIKAEKNDEFYHYLERFKKLIYDKPDLFKEVKSWNTYTSACAWMDI